MNGIPLLLATLGSGAVASIILSRRPHAALFVSLASIVVAGVGSCWAAMGVLIGGQSLGSAAVDWPLPMGSVTLALDGLSAWFLLVIGVVSTATAIYSWDYFRSAIGHRAIWSATALLNMLVAAMVITVCASDVVVFMVGWELMSLSAFLLVGFHHRDPQARRGAWMYLIATHLGMAVGVLPLFGVLVARSGSTSFTGFDEAFGASEVTTCVVLFFLGLVGFGTKAGIMPMHVWLPVAHPVAPSPASALLSGVVIKIGIYALLRLLSWLPTLPVSCAVMTLVFGMVSGVMGVLYALAQHDIKRLLAYHSVENIGIILIGIGMGMLGQTLGQPTLVALGYGGALLHVLNHSLFKGLLFLSAGAVIHATGTGDIERLGGLARKTPINAGLFLLGAVAICGLPPLNGFVSEWLLYGSLFIGAGSVSRSAAGIAAMGAVSLALMGGLALACFAKVFGVVFLGEPRDSTIQAHRTPSSMRLAMLILAVLCAAIGFLPGAFVPLTAGGVVAVSGIDVSEFASQMRSILSPVGHLGLFVTVLLAFVILLMVVRHVLLRRHCEIPVTPVVTWGCGFTRPSARTQYTASSFAWSLIQSFRSLLWAHREVTAPTGPFPAHSELESHTPDLAEHDVFSPLLHGVSRVFRMIRTVSWSGKSVADTKSVPTGGRVGPLRALVAGVATALRQGRIHVFLAFIVLTLLAVFFVEALSSHHPVAPLVPPATSSVDGDQK